MVEETKKGRGRVTEGMRGSKETEGERRIRRREGEEKEGERRERDRGEWGKSEGGGISETWGRHRGREEERYRQRVSARWRGNRGGMEMKRASE